jgi:hypothetical protein
MRKLVIFLSLTSVAFAASTIYLLAGREPLAAPPAPPTANVEAPASAPPPPSMQAPATSQPIAGPPGKAAAIHEPRLNEFDRRFLAEVADPARRVELVSAAKANLKLEYRRLAQVVGLNPDEYDRLLDLLAEKQIAGRDSFLRCLADSAKNPESCPVDMGGLDDELVALIGVERQLLLEKYLSSLQERTLVSRIRGALPDDQFLSEDQADQLVAALAQENARRREELGDALKGIDRIYSEAPLVYTPGATRESLTAEAREHFDRLRARAAQLLTPAQLKTWDSIMEQHFGGVEYAIQAFLDNRRDKPQPGGI